MRNIDRVTGTIFADNDWDGIAGTAIWKRHSDRPVVVARTKLVHSQAGDLVIDVGTDGDGFVVDHHCRLIPPKNPLRFAENGIPCSGRLVYELMVEDGVADETDLILSATAEVVEGLFRRGEGSFGELSARDLAVFRKTVEVANQHSPAPSSFLFALADVLGLVSEIRPEEALRIAIEVIPTLQSWDQFIGSLDPESRAATDRYFRYMSAFCLPSGKARNVGGTRFMELNISTSEMVFAPQILTRVHRLLIGENLLAFRGQCVSLRTRSREAVEWLFRRLGDLADGWGGRCDRWGIHLVRQLTFAERENLFSTL